VSLIGYVFKQVVPRPDWLKAPGVKEICSVSNCISKGPDGWAGSSSSGSLNGWGLSNRHEDARQLVGEEIAGAWDLFGYELVPVRYVGGVREGLDVGSDSVDPLPKDFESLGYDVVSRGRSDFFECSPLSCNGWAEEVGANEHCLVDLLDEAHRLASIAEASGCEPGDYHVVRVWRRRAVVPELRGES
jgi:hypothetical protein